MGVVGENSLIWLASLLEMCGCSSNREGSYPTLICGCSDDDVGALLFCCVYLAYVKVGVGCYNWLCL